MKARTCPVGPDICGDIEGWEAFLAHIHATHTAGTAADRLRQVQEILTRGESPVNKALTALKAVFEDMDSTGRAGDEWAYAWLHEVWPSLVPLDLRVAVGDLDAIEEAGEAG